MIAKDREVIARALRGIDRRLKNIEGNQLVLQSELRVLGEDVRNILLILQETQAQLRASSGGPKLVPDVPTRRARNGNRGT